MQFFKASLLAVCLADDAEDDDGGGPGAHDTHDAHDNDAEDDSTGPELRKSDINDVVAWVVLGVCSPQLYYIPVMQTLTSNHELDLSHDPMEHLSRLVKTVTRLNFCTSHLIIDNGPGDSPSHHFHQIQAKSMHSMYIRTS